MNSKKLTTVIALLATLTLSLQGAIAAHADDFGIDRYVGMGDGSIMATSGGIMYQEAAPGSWAPCNGGLTSCDPTKPITVVNALAPCAANSTIACISEVDASTDGTTWVTGVFKSERVPSWQMYKFAAQPDLGIGASRSSNLYTFDGITNDQGNLFDVVPRMQALIQTGKPIQIQTTSTLVRGVYVDGAMPNPVFDGVGADLVASSNACIDGSSAITTDCWKVATQKTPLFFKIALSLPSQPSGWMNGRLANPAVTFGTNDGNQALPIRITVAGQSVATASIAEAYFAGNPAEYAMWNNLVPVFPYLAWDDKGKGTMLNPASDLKTYLAASAIDPSWNKANWVYTEWVANLDWVVYQPVPATCETSGFNAFVGSNAMLYDGTVPKFNKDTQTFDYEVTSPHFMPDGQAFAGVYSLLIADSTAKCIWGDEPVTGNLSINVTDVNGNVKTANATTSMANGNLLFQATDFTFSADVIHASLTPKLISPAPAPIAKPIAQPVKAIALTALASKKSIVVSVVNAVGKSVTINIAGRTYTKKATSNSSKFTFATTAGTKRVVVVVGSVKLTKTLKVTN